MSYQVLARKWRPRHFREMVGQEHVLRALINALDNDRLHHAYLFTGTRGVGKTTIARILAKCLNCERGVSSEPCGQCDSCLEIAEGRSVDLLEVDAASRTKVEDTRELLENVQYAPTRSRYKVYLIDEVHMLSTHSFNALLKTLEEPPPHVKFLLATTDPQKLPATVLSRCLQFNLKNMPPEQVVGHLVNVLDRESLSYEEPALWLLGRAAAGSMRDALSLTDQAIAFGSGAVREDEVRAMLGSVDLSFVYQLLEAVIAADPAAALEVVGRMAEHAPDFEGSLDEMISLLHRVAVAQVVPDAIDNSWGDAGRVAALAASVSAEDAQLYYQVALNGKRDIGLALEPRSGFEMTLLRMIAFRPEAVIDPELGPEDLQPVQQNVALEGDIPAKKSPDAAARPQGLAPSRSPVAELRSPAPPPAAAASPARQSTAAAEEGTVASSPATAVTAVAATAGRAATAAAQPAPPDPEPAATSIPAPGTLAELGRESWPAVCQALGLVGPAGNTASNCELQAVREGVVSFVLDEGRANLFNERHAAQIGKALQNYFGCALSVSIAVGEVSQLTPAREAERRAQARQAQAVQEIEQDPQLRRLIEQFDGELDAASIAPLERN